MTKLVLLIDDNPDDITIMRALLEERGHVVIPIFDGGQAISKIRENVPHVVICDVYMEDKEGVETLMAIKESYPKLPVVMISADDSYFPILKVLGAHDCVRKTSEYDQLLNLIDNI